MLGDSGPEARRPVCKFEVLRRNFPAAGLRSLDQGTRNSGLNASGVLGMVAEATGAAIMRMYRQIFPGKIAANSVAERRTTSAFSAVQGDRTYLNRSRVCRSGRDALYRLLLSGKRPSCGADIVRNSVSTSCSSSVFS